MQSRVFLSPQSARLSNSQTFPCAATQESTSPLAGSTVAPTPLPVSTAYGHQPRQGPALPCSRTSVLNQNN